MTKTFTVAILGSGKMAKTHFAAYRKLPEIARIVFWGRNKSTLRHLSRRYKNSTFYLDYLEMLNTEKPDFMSVCLPPDMRSQFINPALKSGCHVLCEKPLALTLSEAKSIEQVARETHKQVAIGYALRFLPQVAEIKEKIDRGDLGDIKFFSYSIGRDFRSTNWYNDPHKNPSVFSELGIHGIDLARYFIQSEVVNIKGACIKSRIDRQVSDQGAAILQFANGAMAQINCSFSYPYFEPQMVVIGTLQTAKLSNGRWFIRDLKRSYSLVEMYAKYFIESLYFPWRYAVCSPYYREIRAFVRGVLEKRQQCASIANDIENLRVLFAIQSQSQTSS